MPTLTAWRFAGAGDAGLAAAMLLRLQPSLVRDAAVVEWQPGGPRPGTRRVGPPPPVASGTLGSGFWALVFGLVFFLPLLGAAMGAATGATAGSLTDVGIDDHFINRLRDLVTPGTSALVVLGPDDGVDRVREALASAPPAQALTAHLDAAHEAALREVFGA